MDLLDLALLPARPFKATIREQLPAREVTTVGEEASPAAVGATREGVRRVWRAVEALYRTGLYPAVQLCVRRQGRVALQRAIGHARGNAPRDAAAAERVFATPETPFVIYSASKAVTAMLVHKLDERRVLHLDDRICDYIPEFASHGKEWMTIRHVLAHRAGIPNLPSDAMDLDLLDDPEHVVQLLSEARPLSRPGRRLAYHAISGGFVLGELVRRATGQDVREVLRKELCEPLGLRWMNYGVARADLERVGRDAVTGLPLLPPVSGLFRRALGVPFERAVELANDPRFLTGVVPSANVVATADELCAFYQCLLDGGAFGGVQVFDPRTVRHATSEQTYLELDLTLGIPLRYGLGFMLGGTSLSLFGPDTPYAFGHLGFTNIISWADPARRLAVALVTSGKPFVSLDSLRLWNLLVEIGRAFPPA